MKLKKEKPVNLIATAVLFVLYALTFLIDGLNGHRIALSSTLQCLGGLALYFLFLRRFEPMYYLGILAFTFFAQFFGACLRFYDLIPIYDLILHGASGVLLVLLGHYLLTGFFLRGETVSLRVTLLCCFLFSLAAAGVWEIFEFSGDVLLGLKSQGDSLIDTMTDMIAGSCGAIVGTVLLPFLLKRSKKSA